MLLTIFLFITWTKHNLKQVFVLVRQFSGEDLGRPPRQKTLADDGSLNKDFMTELGVSIACLTMLHDTLATEEQLTSL